VVVALEAAFVSTDVIAIRALLGPAAASVPLSTWVRATCLAYASTILLPTGRAAGEAARAATLAPAVGVGRAAAACARLQASILLGNTVISLIGVASMATRGLGATPLAMAMLGNALLCGVAGSVLLALLRSGRLGAWIKRRFPRFAE